MKEYNHKNIPKNRDLVEHLNYAIYHQSERKAAKVSLQEVFSYTKLQVLNISGNLENAGGLDDIKNLSQLKSLSFAYLGKVKIPTSIAELKQLETLSFNDVASDQYCNEIGDIQQLKSFRIRHSNLKEIPDFVFRLTNLEDLDLSYNDLTVLPPQIGQLKKLKSLILSSNQIETLPDEILQLQDLEILHVDGNKIHTSPNSWDQFPQLKELSIERNQLQHCPSSVQKCAHLEKFTWLNNPFGDLPIELFYLPLETIKHTNQGWYEREKAQEVLKQIKACQKATTRIHRQHLSLIYTDFAAAAKQLTKAELLDLLDVSQRHVHSLVMQAIFAKEAARLSQNPIQKGSKVHITGKTALKKSEVAALLKSYEVQYASRYAKDVSHLVLGDNAKKLDLETQAVILNEQRLQDYLHEMDTPYLLEKDAEDSLNLQHISTLLLSSDLDNARLGLELLEGGGVPKELMTELFIIAKLADDKSMQTKAKKMLKLNASESTLKAVKNRKQFTEYSWSIKTRFEDTDLEVWKIAQYGYKNLNWRYALDACLENCPEEDALNFLHEIMPKEIGANGYLRVDEDKSRFMDYLYHFPNIKTFYSYGNKRIENIPDGISKMTGLEEFRLSHCLVKELPSDFGQLQLKNICIDALPLENWEAELEKINQIKTLEKIHFTLIDGQSLASLAPSETVTEFHLSVGGYGAQHQANPFTSIDQAAIDTILGFKNLKDLQLDGDLEHFPIAFCDTLTAMKSFYLKAKVGQGSCVLPASLSNWENLYVLNINSQIPKGGIPDSLSELQALRIIRIGHLDDEFPEALRALTQLKTLDIEGNMTFLPEWFEELVSLESLEITAAQIQDPVAFAEVIHKMPALKKLRVQKTNTFGPKYKINDFKALVSDIKLDIQRY